MKNIFKNALLSTIIFGMAIASGFAMDNNPPTEPVKKVLETEVISEEVLELTDPVMAYLDENNQCVLIYDGTAPTDCYTFETTVACTITIGLIDYHLRELIFNFGTQQWSCGDLLYKPL